MADDDERQTDRERVWIARARSIKAFKIARVLRLTDVDTAALRTLDQGFRDYVAGRAGVNVPSNESWALACDMLDVMRDDD